MKQEEVRLEVPTHTMPGVEETVHFPLPLGLGDKSMSQLASSRS